MNLIKQISGVVKDLETYSYSTAYLGAPIQLTDEKWIQQIGKVPDSLIQFNRKYLPCPDGYFREPGYATQEHLIARKILTKYSDVCTNIPWKYFYNRTRKKSSDLRVQRIQRHLKCNNLNASKLRDEIYSKTTGIGFPDITDFGKKLITIEVKFLADTLRSEQKIAHEILRQFNIPCIILEYKEQGRLLNEYSLRRRHISIEGVRIYEEFRRSLAAKKLLSLSGDRNGSWSTQPSETVNVISTMNRMNRFSPKIKILTCNEVISTTYALMRAGTLRWWMVPDSLVPYIGKIENLKAMDQLLALAIRFDNIFKTNSMYKPQLAMFQKRPGFRLRPK